MRSLAAGARPGQRGPLFSEAGSTRTTISCSRFVASTRGMGFLDVDDEEGDPARVALRLLDCTQLAAKGRSGVRAEDERDRRAPRVVREANELARVSGQLERTVVSPTPSLAWWGPGPRGDDMTSCMVSGESAGFSGAVDTRAPLISPRWKLRCSGIDRGTFSVLVARRFRRSRSGANQVAVRPRSNRGTRARAGRDGAQHRDPSQDFARWTLTLPRSRRPSTATSRPVQW